MNTPTSPLRVSSTPAPTASLILDRALMEIL